MYVGHVGAALGAKRLAPSVAVGTLVIMAYLPDWVDATLCISGQYHGAQMLSHSVPAVLVLALLAAATQLRQFDVRASAVVALVVVSHMLLDYFTGIKPTWPGGPMIGLQMYRRPALDFAIEAVVIFGGWIFYRRTLPLNNRGRLLSRLMLATLLLMQAGVDIGRLLLPSINKC